MKSKITLVLFTAVLIVSIAAKAQKTENVQSYPKNEVNLGYGMLTGPEVANAMIFPLFTVMGVGIARDTVKDIDPSAYGVVTFSYKRYLKRWVSLGGSASMNPITTHITTKKGLDLTYSMYLFSVMPRVDFYYFNKGYFSLYSGLEVGASFDLYSDRSGNTNANTTGVSAAFHVNAIGMRIGKEIGGFMEFGFGYRGIMNFGISGRF
jgi:hypothetical protein